MSDVIRSKSTVVWLFMSAITVLSWWLAASHGSNSLDVKPMGAVGVLLIGFVKSGLVLWHFMEAGAGPGWLP